MAVNTPRDWHRIRDRLFSIFYNFITRSGTVGIICLTGLMSITSYFLTGSISDGILSAIVIYTLIVFIKVFYFYDLPKGWSYTQWRNWLRQGGSNDVISRHRKQIVIGLCVLISMGFLNGLIKPNSFDWIGMLGGLGVIATLLNSYRKYQSLKYNSHRNK